MDIDSAEHIVDVTNKNPQGQTLDGKGLEDQYHDKDILTTVQPLVVLDSVEKLYLMQEKKAKAQATIEVWKLKEQEVQDWILDEKTAVQPLKTEAAQLMLEWSHRVLNPTFYTSHLQKEFDQFVKVYKHTFKQQPMSYPDNKVRYDYANQFLTGILVQDWENLQRHIEVMAELVQSFTEFFKVHQDRFNSKHICQFDMIVRTKRMVQQNTQSVTKLISYLDLIEQKMEPVPVEVEQF